MSRRLFTVAVSLDLTHDLSYFSRFVVARLPRLFLHASNIEGILITYDLIFSRSQTPDCHAHAIAF